MIMPVRVCEALPGIADYQDVDWLQIGGQIELPAQDIRLEVAHPYAAQAQFCGLEHHMIGQDRGINVPGLLLVKGSNPCLVVVNADDDSKRCTVQWLLHPIPFLIAG